MYEMFVSSNGVSAFPCGVNAAASRPVCAFVKTRVIARRGVWTCCVDTPHGASSNDAAPPQAQRAKNATSVVAVEQVSVEERVMNELAERGIDLEELLNPSKVINLERKIDEKKMQLAALEEENQGQAHADSTERAAALQLEISKLEKQSTDEKRQVMFEWLKTTFAVQGVLGLVVAGGLAKGGDFTHDSNILSAAFFQGNEIPLVARALGFWLVWMFTIPSLRARKPSRTEKAALNLAFAVVPVANVVAPFITKDPWLIYWGDIALLTACYMFYFVFKVDPKDAPKLKGKWKWLDWSSRM